MATVEDKENVAPLASIDLLQAKNSTPSPKRSSRKGRSKSIGPGGLEEVENAKQDAKNRRKSTYVPATKSIISSDIEKAERQAARRKTLANRRVSFAPEATLHTWDVVEFMRDPTTSTESSDATRRTSKGSPFKRAATIDSDPPSSPAEQDDTFTGPLNGAEPSKKQRRHSGIPTQPYDESDDGESDDAESVDASDSGEEDAEGSEDDTGTAMSLDVDNNTIQSMVGSEAGSTDSSARLEAALRQAADTAGTRGIEYDEYGDASMELAGDEITNAFKPWAEQHAANRPVGSASMDQENVNPFSPAFKAQLISGTVNRPSTVREEDTGDLSMDMTRAVGGVVRQPSRKPDSSPLGDGTMDLTQAVGQIQQSAQAGSPQTRSGQKRRRSTTDAGSPGAAPQSSSSKRRRSSVARSSMGDDAMDLTVAVGGVRGAGSPGQTERRKSTVRRRSSGVTSEQDDATMEFTQAVGGIKAAVVRVDHTGSSFDENEELTMELTTVLGGIKPTERAADETLPSTPQHQSPIRERQNTTPKDQERFIDPPDSGPKKLLTPIFQKQVLHSAEKTSPISQFPKSAPPITRTRDSTALEPVAVSHSLPTTPQAAPRRSLDFTQMPSLGDHKSPLRGTPPQSPARKQSSATPDSVLKEQLVAQLHASEPQPSPLTQKQQRSSPVRIPSTPQQPNEPTMEGRQLAESIKLMSTPRKETLKNRTPRKAAQPSPQGLPLSQTRSAVKALNNANISPAKQLSNDLNAIQGGDVVREKIQLQSFLDAAGIRFMDLTTTKRRMTTAVTPSKARKAAESQDDIIEGEVDLGSAIVAGGCTLPELGMYEHACHELKRYISDGKKVIKELEMQTARETPPLIQAYMAAGTKRRAAIDAQMRNVKTHARYRSKEVWYSWRSQLLEDLMKALQSVGEGLVRDDETLRRAEEVLEAVLPGLVERLEDLQAQADTLEQVAAETNEDEREELEEARERLLGVESELSEKQKVLEQLQAAMEEQQSGINDLEESKEEFAAAIKEADRVREACRGVSISEITDLKESIRALEQTYGWSITSASSSPATVTMTYKSHLQLFFHPAAFRRNDSSTSSSAAGTNAPISLTYISDQQPSTTLRFFLQLLRASLQALPQSTTKVPGLLSLVSSGWETALALSTAEQRLAIETLTTTRIVSDECLAISATLLLPQVRTKVCVTFDVAAGVGSTQDENDESVLRLRTFVRPAVKVVYGELYNETKMTEFVEKQIRSDGGAEFEGWSAAVRELRERLVAKGAKGAGRK